MLYHVLIILIKFFQGMNAHRKIIGDVLYSLTSQEVITAFLTPNAHTIKV